MTARQRHRIVVRGVVQGVGFRPFVYATARELGLSGLVGNTGDGVLIEVEGPPGALAAFADRLEHRAPPLARVDDVAVEAVVPRGGTDFAIIDSSGVPGGRTLVAPDVATCDACLAELADPTDRRYRHPFISCTNCGPRFTIIVDLPYDRPATTMAALPLCAECAAEYADPADRRFHAQTVACPECGPVLTLHQPGEDDLTGTDALAAARRLLATGGVVAVKGLGGYHLACDATEEAAVASLRKRKDRGDKPFAVMADDLDTVALLARADAAELALLTDPRRPVVLLRRRSGQRLRLASAVAPGSPDLGVMLPYTPVHRLLFGLPGDPPGPCVLVMTSGNLGGEPIVTDDVAARDRLGALADAWLSHDRPIRVPCDDSVVRVVPTAGSAGVHTDGPAGELPVRRSRGYAPLPIALPVRVRPALAVGGDLKNTFCVADGGYAWMSAHVGDMDDLATLQAFEAATAQLAAITRVRPELVVADRHPGYRSTAWARRSGLPLSQVQHHHAHIASAMAENGHAGDERVIGFALDGTGYGDDCAVWGGEVLLADYEGYTRAAHLRYTPLPGGDAGVRNPCRMALAHLHAAGLAWDPRLPSVAACGAEERAVLARQLETGLCTASTSSMGRLFDAVSSLAGVCHRVAYEAEAAMRFEGLARLALEEDPFLRTASDRASPSLRMGCHDRAYAFGLPVGAGPWDPAAGPVGLDPGPVVAAVAADVLAGVDPGVVAARFHIAVAALVADTAVALRRRTGLSTVALSGGVFLNVLLTALCVDRLSRAGFTVLRHRRVPPSDAGLALGQIVVAARVEEKPCA